MLLLVLGFTDKNVVLKLGNVYESRELRKYSELLFSIIFIISYFTWTITARFEVQSIHPSM